MPPRSLAPRPTFHPHFSRFARGAASLGLAASSFTRTTTAEAAAPKTVANSSEIRVERLACSFRAPFCVEGARAESPRAAALVADLDRAWRSAVVGLALAEPAVDPATGRVRVELGATSDGSLVETRLWRDPLDIFDRAYVTLRVDPSAAPGCARDHALAAAVARASLARLAPAIVEPVAHGMTEALADLAVTCAADDDARFLAQQRPERSLLGSPLFWGDLDASYGASPGALLSTMAMMIPTTTTGPLPPLDPALPDPFSVLRRTFDEPSDEDASPQLANVLLDMSVRRLYLAEGRDLAADWRIPWPLAARRLAVTPIEPLGSAYLVIDLRGPNAPPDPSKARLRVEAEWEQHAQMRSALIRLDADGRAIGRMDIPVPQKGTHAQMSMVDLSNTATVVVVVTNLGDHAVPLGARGAAGPEGVSAVEPHGSLFTLAAE